MDWDGDGVVILEDVDWVVNCMFKWLDCDGNDVIEWVCG